MDRLLVPGLLLVLALLFMAPGLPPDRVAAPMPRTLVYPPWHVYYPDLKLNVNPPIVGGDLLWAQLPWRHWMQQELAAGRFPLWASAPMGGQPLFASYQPGVLDPLHLLWVLLPIGAGLGLVMAFKLWLAGVGMWGFLLALGLRRSAALLGSLGFMFSAWMVDWLVWQYTEVYALLPWLTWAAYAWCVGGRRRALLGLVLLGGWALLVGAPEPVFVAGVLTALWALGLIAAQPLRRWLPRLAGIAVAGGLALGLAAIQLLPFYEILGLSQSVAIRPPSRYIIAGFLDASKMIDWVLPRFWGYLPEYVLGDTSLVTAMGYVGLVALLGLLLALFATLRRGIALRLAGPWLLIGLLSWLIVYDDHIGRLIRSLPVLNVSRNDYWILAIAFAILVISAFGWDWWARHLPGRPGRQRIWSLVALVLLAGGGAVLVAHLAHLLPGPGPLEPEGAAFKLSPGYQRYWAIWGAGLALAALGGAALWRAPRPFRRAAPVVLAVLVLVDLWRFGYWINPSAPAADYFPSTPFTTLVREVVPPTERILIEGDALPANTAMIYGIRDWRGQDPMMGFRAFQAAQFLYPAIMDNVWNWYNVFLRDVRLPVAPLLGMRYFVFPSQTDPNKPNPPDPDRPHFTQVLSENGLDLWAVDGVPGFAYLSDKLTIAATPEAAATWMREMTWGRVRAYPAVVEAPAAAVASIALDPARRSPGSTTVQVYRPGHIEILADAQRPALLVVAESLYPGWHATLDGRPVDILRTNYISQGVVVPAGRHLVTLDYAPDSFRVGALISGLAALGTLLLAGWVGWAGRRERLRLAPAGAARLPPPDDPSAVAAGLRDGRDGDPGDVDRNRGVDRVEA